MKQKNIKIYPIRVIPFDLGYSITDKIHKKIKKLLLQKYSITINNYAEKNIQYFNIDSFSKYLFSDGIGICVYRDDIINCNNLTDNVVKNILKEKNVFHNCFLGFNHCLSPMFSNILVELRNIVSISKRRFTSNPNWENKGLSYVFSFYFIETNKKEFLEEEHFVMSLCNLLFPDNLSASKSSYSNYNQNYINVVLENQDIVNNIHFCSSWATGIICKHKKVNETEFNYFINIEIELQHIWFHTYIAEKIIDNLLQCSIKKIKTKDLKKYYTTIADIKLIVEKYKGVLSSTSHEREHKLYSGLMKSSKLDTLLSSVNEKSQILEKKLLWIINEKGLKNNTRAEILLFALTLFQCFGVFEYLESGNLNIYYLFGMILIFLIYLINRLIR